ncbi:hypothetical protein VSU19_06090 [Verrucomicrobiales bacterium BCK34]|nr:hypothetical protein [Verrucomicrobiales bacterium BCK34]
MGDPGKVGGAGRGCKWPWLFVIFLVMGIALAEEKEDPGSRWVSAYGWIQTGDRLASVELWPLAIGSYIEADRQIKILAEEHPEFEPDVVAYRLEKLKEDIEVAQEALTSGEHDIMMKYLDFIESYELGKKQRFENKFEDSLSTLSEARSILDELIEEKPNEFETAVETQHELLDDSIDWLYSQVSFKRQESRVVSVGDGYDWGSTQYVKESDLPSSKVPVEPFGGLFPNVPVVESPVEDDDVKVAMEKEVQAGEKKSAESPGGGMRFRMNSRAKAVGGEKSDDAE